MESINKIIEGLEHCDFWSYEGEPCNDCPYHLNNDCLNHLKTDVIDLLKQQEDRIRFLTRAIEQMPKPTKLLDVFGNGYAKIVRCKDCNHYNSPNNPCGSLGIYTKPNWFCADGERREQNELER